jgi:hypothetical protein
MFAHTKVRTVQYVVLFNVYVYFLVVWKVLRPGTFHDWGSELGRFVFGTFRGLDRFEA